MSGRGKNQYSLLHRPGAPGALPVDGRHGKTYTAVMLAFVVLLPAIYLAGCVSDDAMITQDDEPDWEIVESPFRYYNADHIAIDDEGSIYAGWGGSVMLTGGGISDLPPDAPVRIFVSRNKGDRWENTGFRGRYVESIAAGRDGTIFVISSNDGYRIHRSGDGGGTWTELDAGFEYLCCSDMAMDSEGWIFMDVARTKGVYRSSDNGDSWSRVFDGEVICIAFDLGDHVYLGTHNGLYRSKSRGDSWSCMDTTVEGRSYIEQVAVDSGGCIYVKASSPDSARGFYRSADDGETWEKLCINEYCYAPSYFFVTPDDKVFAAYYGGFYRSGDNGGTWEKIGSEYGYGFSGIRALEVDPDGDIFLLTDHYLYCSEDKGDTWTIAGLPHGDIAGIALDSGGKWWAAFHYGGVYFSSDNFSSWNQFNSGLENTGIRCLAVTGAGSVLAGTTAGIYRSPADYPVWSYIGPDRFDIRELVAGEDNCILAGAVRNGVFVSYDGGNTWENIGMAGYNIVSLLMDGGGIYAGADFGGVFRYSGGGIVWDQLNEGLEDLHITTMSAGPAGCIYAGTGDGVYILGTDGLRWNDLGLEQYSIKAIYVDGGNNIFAGTNGGVFRRSPGLSRWESVSRGPNRFNVYSLLPGPDGHLYAISGYIYRSTFD